MRLYKVTFEYSNNNTPLTYVECHIQIANKINDEKTNIDLVEKVVRSCYTPYTIGFITAELVNISN
jgi:hypothetical protein